MEDPTTGLKQILAEIKDTSIASGRGPAKVQLTVASKTQPIERLVPLLKLGHRVFGENRVQEAQAKWPQLQLEYPDLELRMIGPLQSNKAEDAVRLFDVIETVDRISLAKALYKAMNKLKKPVRCYVEVNIGNETQKAGVAPEEAAAFISRCRDEFSLHIEGLMCIPPANCPPGPFFAKLRDIAIQNGIENLSMGMSADFGEAIRHGSTHVRIGTAVFGSRQPN